MCDFPQVARKGRDQQRYSENGARLVAGVIALSSDRTKVLVISSSQDRKKFVLPKGGWELDEQSAEEAAQREAYEEAGKISKSLDTIYDKSLPKLSDDGTTKVPSAEYHFFEMIAEKLHDKYPEVGERGRQWMSYADAKTALGRRPELVEAIERSSIKR